MLGYQYDRFRFWCIRKIENLTIWIVWRLPRTLVMWCAIRVVANATTGKWGHEITPEVRALDAIKRW